ncbi:ATP synthase F0 subunit C [bacterium]|nr:ATP synthase F0 subunit C [bacterium]
MEIAAMKALAAGLCMGLGALGPALGEGYIGGQALKAIGRNPEVADKVSGLVFVLMAVCESTGIYSLVVALILLFA